MSKDKKSAKSGTIFKQTRRSDLRLKHYLNNHHQFIKTLEPCFYSLIPFLTVEDLARLSEVCGILHNWTVADLVWRAICLTETQYAGIVKRHLHAETWMQLAVSLYKEHFNPFRSFMPILRSCIPLLTECMRSMAHSVREQMIYDPSIIHYPPTVIFDSEWLFRCCVALRNDRHGNTPHGLLPRLFENTLKKYAEDYASVADIPLEQRSLRWLVSEWHIYKYLCERLSMLTARCDEHDKNSLGLGVSVTFGSNSSSNGLGSGNSNGLNTASFHLMHSINHGKRGKKHRHIGRVHKAIFASPNFLFGGRNEGNPKKKKNNHKFGDEDAEEQIDLSVLPVHLSVFGKYFMCVDSCDAITHWRNLARVAQSRKEKRLLAEVAVIFNSIGLSCPRRWFSSDIDNSHQYGTQSITMYYRKKFFQLSRDACLLSPYLREFMGREGHRTVDMSWIDGDECHLRRLVQFLEYYVKEPMPNIATPVRSRSMRKVVPKWYSDFALSCNRKDCFVMILIGNALAIGPLVHLFCARIAMMIKSLKPEEVREIMALEEQMQNNEDEDRAQEYDF